MEQQKLHKANQAMLKNDFNTAIKFYTEALVIKQHFGTYLNLSVAYKRIGNIDQAIKCIQKSLILNKSNPGTYLNYGNLLKLKGLEKQAMKQYLMALQVDSKYAPTYNSIGTLMRSQGKLDEARKNFQKAIQYDGSYQQAKNNLKLLKIQQQHQILGFGQKLNNNIKLDIVKD